MRTRTLTRFRPQIRSKQPSHRVLRGVLPLLPYRSLIRLGSVTEVQLRPGTIEINPIQFIRNSSNKKLSKECFTRANCKTADWYIIRNNHWQKYINGRYENLNYQGNLIDNLPLEYPIVCKANFGMQGDGNTLVHNREEFEQWLTGKDLSRYVVEKFHNYGHEFRIHVHSEGYFYTCRKALRQDTPQEERWRMHNDTSVFLLETNENFQRPSNWDEIVDHCKRALLEMGGDVAAFDVKVQTPVTGGIRRPYQDFIILESNSAPSMDNGTGELSICAQKYIEELPRIITRKANRNR